MKTITLILGSILWAVLAFAFPILAAIGLYTHDITPAITFICLAVALTEFCYFALFIFFMLKGE